MRKLIQQKLKNQKGLTLIELLAVIVILAIIAAIAIPAIGNIIENSRVGAIKSDATNILNAAEIFAADNSEETTVDLFTLQDQGYINDAGTFEDLDDTAAATVDVDLATMALTGTNAPVNDITVAFVAATKSHIAQLTNSADDGAFTADPVFPSGTTITVDGRD